jgi:hypothetical protein
MSTTNREIVRKWVTLTFNFVLKSGSLNLLEPSGPVQACNGIAFAYI